MRSLGRGFLTFLISALLVMVYFLFIFFFDFAFKQNLFWDTMPDFLGGALGIILAFGFYRWVDETKDSRRIKEIKQMLRAELESCLKLSKQQGGNLLPTVSWRLLLSTGDLRLLSFDQFRAISNIYTIIENQNYESTQLRNTGIITNAGLTGNNATDAQKNQYLTDVRTRNITREQNTANEIQNILNEQWWNQ